MQFSSFTKIQEGLTITLYNETPIENVEVIKYYSDNSSGSFVKKEFRWSFNNVYWSAWETINQQSISRVNTHGNYYLFIQVRYILSTIGAGNVSRFTINYTAGTATITPTIIHQDIEIPERYQITAITDASTLNGYSGSWYLSRSHHTGTQPISSILGLQDALNNLISASGVTQFYVDGSLAIRDASIQNVANKNIQQDISINQLWSTFNSTIINYLLESSIGSGFSWNAGYLDISVGTGISVAEISTNYNANSNELIAAYVDDVSLSITLPGLPVLGSTIEIIDITRNASTNNITVIRNTHNIDKVAEDFIIDVDGGSIKLMYDTLNNNYAILNIETRKH